VVEPLPVLLTLVLARACCAPQIARTAAIFNMDELVIIDDTPQRKDGTVSAGAAFLARVAQYLETPQYLRKALIPMHPDLRLAGEGQHIRLCGERGLPNVTGPLAHSTAAADCSPASPADNVSVGTTWGLAGGVRRLTLSVLAQPRLAWSWFGMRGAYIGWPEVWHAGYAS
jgi:hypothetical protein